MTILGDSQYGTAGVGVTCPIPVTPTRTRSAGFSSLTCQPTTPISSFSRVLLELAFVMPLLCAIPTFSVSLLSIWVCSWGNHSSFKVSAIDHSGFPTFIVNYFNSPATHSSEGFLRDPISVLGISNPCSFESVLCPPDLLTPACTHSFDTYYHWYVFVFTWRFYSFILIHICSYLHRFNLRHTHLSSLV